MQDFIDFLGFHQRAIEHEANRAARIVLMPANFSSMVGEFMAAAIPKYCQRSFGTSTTTGTRICCPRGRYPGDSILHGPEESRSKASPPCQRLAGPQPEDVWLMVFVFDSNTSRDAGLGIEPRPFRFVKVVGGHAREG